MSQPLEDVAAIQPSNPIDTSEKVHTKRKRDKDAAAGARSQDLSNAPATKKKRRREKDNDTSGNTTTASVAPITHEAIELQSPNLADSASPFLEQTTSFYLPLSPIGQLHPLESLCAEHLSPILLTYFSPLKGIVVSYKNPRLSTELPTATAGQGPVLARSINEYGVNYLWLTADFTILKPIKGAWIEGHVTIQSESHLGLVCWNHFNASVEQKRLPSSWRWVGNSTGNMGKAKVNGNVVSPDEEYAHRGHYVDENGEKVDGLVKFRVRDFETTQYFGKERGITTIMGTLLDDQAEERLAQFQAGSRKLNADRHSTPRHRSHTRDRDRARPEVAVTA